METKSPGPGTVPFGKLLITKGAAVAESVAPFKVRFWPIVMTSGRPVPVPELPSNEPGDTAS